MTNNDLYPDILRSTHEFSNRGGNSFHFFINKKADATPRIAITCTIKFKAYLPRGFHRRRRLNYSHDASARTSSVVVVARTHGLRFRLWD